MVVNKDDVMHVIWNSTKGGFRYSNSRDGVTWAKPRKVEYKFVEKEGYPYKLLPSPDGLINIFWINGDGNLIINRANSEQMPDPTSWTASERVGDSVLNFDIDITADGVFHLIYIQNNEKTGVYYRRSPNGAQWSEPLLLYTSEYLGSIKFDNAHVRVSASDDLEAKTVLVAWDVLPIKRLFMANSKDSGFTFSEAIQIKGPEDTGGFGTPYNIEIGVHGNKAMLTWQVGEPGATQCAFYSQISEDGGQQWTGETIMLNSRAVCPEEMKFIIEQDDFFMVMLKYTAANPALMVWNGSIWGELQVQNEISSFINPLTFDNLLFRCENETLVGTTLYFVGCDEGTSRDIWVTSRSLEPIEQWIGSSPVWSFPDTLVSEPQSIAYVTQSPGRNLIHAVWAGTTLSDAGSSSHSIYYAQFDGQQWTASQAMVRGLIGKPVELSMTVSEQGTLFLVWVDADSGSLVYASATADHADIPSEWTEPQGIPSISTLNHAPDILVDASEKIVMVYSIPFNEGRGIYMMESSDRGNTWSLPVQVFDALATGWDMVDHPQVSLSGDGALHVLFTRFAQQGNPVGGLYYSRSSDGGVTWSAPEIVSDGSVTWSDTISYDGFVVHRLWQEDRIIVVSNFDQVSRDGGLTWDAPVEITGVLDRITPVTLVADGIGGLHFMRIVEGESPGFVKEYELIVEDWVWDGAGWNNRESQKATIQGERAEYAISAALTLNGVLSVLVSAEYLDLDGKLISEINSTNRVLDVNPDGKQPFSAVVAAQTISDQPPTEIAGIQTEQSPLAPVEEQASSQFINKNLFGGILVLVILILGVFFLRRRARAN